MKIEISKQKNLRGRITGYCASFGDVTAYASTPTEAKEQVEHDLRQLASYNTKARVYSIAGHVVVISASAMGNVTQCIWPDGRKSESHSSTDRSFEELEDSARYNIAQCIWPDPQSFDLVPQSEQSDFASWVNFQERYQEGRAQGMNDCDAHSYACQIAA